MFLIRSASHELAFPETQGDLAQPCVGKKTHPRAISMGAVRS